MSVSRMKNLIILVLSICAACLLAVAVPNRLSQTHEQRRMLAELKTLYESYGLRIELDELPRSPTLYSVELSESGAQTAAQALLGQKAVQPDGGDRFESEYTSELGTLTLTRTGGFSAVLTGGAHVRNYEKSAAKLLHSMGFQFQQLSRRQTEAGVTLEAEQTLLGVPVFGSGRAAAARGGDVLYRQRGHHARLGAGVHLRRGRAGAAAGRTRRTRLGRQRRDGADARLPAVGERGHGYALRPGVAH